MNNEVKLKISGDTSQLVKDFADAIAKIQKMAGSGLKMPAGTSAAPGANVATGGQNNRTTNAAGAAAKESIESVNLLRQILAELKRSNQQTHLNNLAQNRFTPVVGAANRPINGSVSGGTSSQPPPPP